MFFIRFVAVTFGQRSQQSAVVFCSFWFPQRTYIFRRQCFVSCVHPSCIHTFCWVLFFFFGGRNTYRQTYTNTHTRQIKLCRVRDHCFVNENHKIKRPLQSWWTGGSVVSNLILAHFCCVYIYIWLVCVCVFFVVDFFAHWFDNVNFAESEFERWVWVFFVSFCMCLGHFYGAFLFANRIHSVVMFHYNNYPIINNVINMSGFSLMCMDKILVKHNRWKWCCKTSNPLYSLQWRHNE